MFALLTLSLDSHRLCTVLRSLADWVHMGLMLQLSQSAYYLTVLTPTLTMHALIVCPAEARICKRECWLCCVGLSRNFTRLFYRQNGTTACIVSVEGA